MTAATSAGVDERPGYGGNQAATACAKAHWAGVITLLAARAPRLGRALKKIASLSKE